MGNTTEHKYNIISMGNTTENGNMAAKVFE